MSLPCLLSQPREGPWSRQRPEPPAGLPLQPCAPSSQTGLPPPCREQRVCVWSCFIEGPPLVQGCSGSSTRGRSIHLPTLPWPDPCLAGELTLKPPTSLQTTSSCQVPALLIQQTVNHQLRGHSRRTGVWPFCAPRSWLSSCDLGKRWVPPRKWGPE